MTPTTIALIAIPSAAALAFMWWKVARAPVIDDEPLWTEMDRAERHARIHGHAPDNEREARRVCETPEQRLRRIERLGR